MDATFRKVAKHAITFAIWKIDEDRLEAVQRSHYGTFYDSCAYIIYAASLSGHYANHETIVSSWFGLCFSKVLTNAHVYRHANRSRMWVLSDISTTGWARMLASRIDPMLFIKSRSWTRIWETYPLFTERPRIWRVRDSFRISRRVTSELKFSVRWERWEIIQISFQCSIGSINKRAPEATTFSIVRPQMVAIHWGGHHRLVAL